MSRIPIRLFSTALMLPLVAILAGCNSKSTQGTSTSTATDPPATSQPSSVTPWTTYNPLNANNIQQFANALVEIPLAPADPANPTTFNIAVRQGSWDFGLHDRFGAVINNPLTGQPISTTTWGYDINGAFLGVYGATVEATKGTALTVNYTNALRAEVNGVKGTGPYLTHHLLQMDYTLDGTDSGEPECRITTHLHGGDVPYTSDGHPDAWVTNDPAVQAKWAAKADPSIGFPGRPATNQLAPFTYPNAQEACTLWFHDHSMGITRLNAYAGVAAFYLVKDPAVEGAGSLANLPKGRHANPVVPTLQSDEFDLPLAIQDKAFLEDGSLAFPTFTNLGTYTYNSLRDSSGNALASVRPEMWGNVITVNGKAWPYKNVKTQIYRFRLLNGSDSRMYNLWLQDADTGEIITPDVATEAAPTLTWPVVQIAADQGYRDVPVDVATGPGTGGLLLTNGARADILIDFGHPVFTGRNIILRNDCPAPFGGMFGAGSEDETTLDPKTTGKVMMFKVAANAGTPSPLLAKAGTLAAGQSLRDGMVPFVHLTPDREEGPRLLDMQERKEPVNAFLDPTTGLVTFRTILLMNNMMFHSPITEFIQSGTTEEWVFINSTPDVHPMHVHLVKYEVIEKGFVDNITYPGVYHKADGTALPIVDNPAAFIPNAEPGLPDPVTGKMPAANSAPVGSLYAVQPNEINVWKDIVTVPPALVPQASMTPITCPGYVRIRAKFVGSGAYMYHCHILSHEENEMMRPFMMVPAVTPTEK